MTTTVHIPEALLELVDERAKVLGKSRNRVIIEALEASLVTNLSWPPEFVRVLNTPLDRRTSDEFIASMAVVRSRRVTRRRAPKL